MPDYKPTVKQITKQLGGVFRPASKARLSKLQALGLPQSMLDFYASYEPSECIEGQIRIWPIDHILEENEEFVPGCYCSKHGFVVFATTYCGDAYCFDTRQGKEVDPGIVLISHEVVSEETTPADLARLAKPVAGNLHEFLEQFVRGEIDEDCVYK